MFNFFLQKFGEREDGCFKELNSQVKWWNDGLDAVILKIEGKIYLLTYFKAKIDIYKAVLPKEVWEDVDNSFLIKKLPELESLGTFYSLEMEEGTLLSEDYEETFSYLYNEEYSLENFNVEEYISEILLPKEIMVCMKRDLPLALECIEKDMITLDIHRGQFLEFNNEIYLIDPFLF